MNTKAKTKSVSGGTAAVKKVKRAVRRHRAETGGDIERYLHEAKTYSDAADKKYVEIKNKIGDVAKDLQEKAEDIRDQAAKKIDEWLK